MRQERFAELASGHLESMARSLEENSEERMLDVTRARARELRVAAHVVHDLSEVVRREDDRFDDGDARDETGRPLVHASPEI